MRFYPILILVHCVYLKTAQSVLVNSGALEQLLTEATLVAEVEILDVQSRWHGIFHASHIARAKIKRVLSLQDDGWPFPKANDVIEIVGIGGEFQDKGVFLAGLARPYVGQAYFAHLKRNEGYVFQITGLEKGLTPVRPRRLYSRNRTDGSNGDGTGPFLYWDDRYFPLPYAISRPTFSNLSMFVTAIDRSFQTWREPLDSKIEFIGLGCSSQIKNENDGINTVIFVTESWPLEPSIIAITRNFYISNLSAKAGMILDSDILLNAVNHGFTTEDEPGKHDIQNILTHEIGHLIGLGHEVNPADPEAAMYAVASPNETKKRLLHPSDLVGLIQAYGGVGQKINGANSPCDVSSKPLSCGAVSGTCPPSGLGPLLYLVLPFLNILLVRLTARDSFKPGK